MCKYLLNFQESNRQRLVKIFNLLLCVFYIGVSYGQNGISQLKIEKSGDRFVYTIGDMRTVFPGAFVSAKPFTNDNLAIVMDSLYYLINLKGERVSPYFQDVERHKSGLYIGKESDESGYAIYGVDFKKLTQYPFEKIYECRENLFKCISSGHLTYITTSGFVLADFDIPFEWTGCQEWYPYYVLSRKECEKYGINDYLYDYAIIRFKNTNGQYVVGYCDYQGNILANLDDYKKAAKMLKKSKKSKILPLYKKFWDEKKNAFENCSNIFEANILKAAELYPKQFDSPMMAGVATQKQIKNKKGKITQKAGMYFINHDTNEKFGDIYDKISPLGSRYFLVRNYGKKHAIANLSGNFLSEFVYDEFSLWSDTAKHIYRYAVNGKYGLKALPQKDILACDFEHIGDIVNEFAIAIENENGSKKYYVLNKEGGFVAPYTYDNIIKGKDGKYKAYLGEGDSAFVAILDPITGEETSPTMQEQFFDRVVDEEMEPNEMIETYDLIIQMGGPVTAAAYNNKGVAYEELDDIAKARECYETAKKLGSEKATENLQLLDEQEAAEAEKIRQRLEQARLEKEKRRQEGLNAVVSLLGSLAEVMGGGSNASGADTPLYNEESDNSTAVSTGTDSNYKEENDKLREKSKEKRMQNNAKKNDRMVDAAYSKCEENIIDMYVHHERYSNLSKEEFRRKYREAQQRLKRIRTSQEQKTGTKYRVSEYETKACPI